MDERSSEWPRYFEGVLLLPSQSEAGLYARELPIAVVTYFIDEREDILDLLLEHLLSPGFETDECSFHERYGLRFDEPLIRFRVLDVALQDSLRLICR